MTPPHGETMRRTGWVLSILQKGSDGRWRIARDANLLSTV
jgi:ketosteroid isomerase-like protein